MAISSRVVTCLRLYFSNVLRLLKVVSDQANSKLGNWEKEDYHLRSLAFQAGEANCLYYVVIDYYAFLLVRGVVLLL